MQKDKQSKKHSKPNKRGRGDRAPRTNGANGAIDWSPLFAIAEDGVIWLRQLALDAASAQDRPAIERVFRAAFALIDGRDEDAQPADLVTTVRVVGRALERDRGWSPGRADLFAAIIGVAFDSPPDTGTCVGRCERVCSAARVAAPAPASRASVPDPAALGQVWNAAPDRMAVPARSSTPALDALFNQLLPLLGAQAAHR